MSTIHTEPGQSDLHAGLSAEVVRIRDLLAAHRDGLDPAGVPTRAIHLPSLDDLRILLGLTGFERDLLMLAAAVELDGGVAAEVTRQVDDIDPRPTIGLALACLPEAHWDALLPDSPLRAWRLVEFFGDGPLPTRRFSIDERVLHHLLGLPGLDRRLLGIVSSLSTQDLLTPSQLEAVERIEGLLRGQQEGITVHLTGEDRGAMAAIASRLVSRAGGTPLRVEPGALPHPGPDLDSITRLIDREGVLSRRLPVIIGDGDVPRINSFLASTAAPLVIVIGDHSELEDMLGSRPVVAQRIPLPRPSEQRDLWRVSLNGLVDDDMERAIEDVAQTHRLSAVRILSIARQVSDPDGPGGADRLRRECREQSRARLEPYAQLVSSRAYWEDLVMPPGHLETLHDIVRHVRHRTTVYEEWGFAEKTARGLGVTALFSGESGTGKTLAAEIIANDLGLDLYRIDLAATVSKYIGETEKNLSRIFDAAESSGAVLLFDEADALFGKRSEVRDSHDRYANMEIAYLLQRMEGYRGLAILTTNLRNNLDRAFIRRLRFVIQFPFPDESYRAEIWRRVFPDRTPLEGVDAAKLARLTIPGGSIWSIAVSAAFAAAEAGSAVTTEHLLRAARAEYAKSDRTLTETELGAVR